MTTRALSTCLVLVAFAAGCSSAADEAVGASSAGIIDSAGEKEPPLFSATISPTENYGLYVTDKQKSFFNDWQRDRCGGDYIVTLVIDVGRVTTSSIYIKTVQFWTEGQPILFHDPFVWVGTNATHMIDFHDWSYGTDDYGKPYLLYQVNTEFPLEAHGDGLMLQHTITPSPAATNSGQGLTPQFGNPAVGTAIVSGAPVNSDPSFCSMTLRGALTVSDEVRKPPIGGGGGDFCPKDQVPRRDMARYLVRLKHGADFTPPSASGRYEDVAPNDAPWVEQLATDGITRGCGQGDARFCPNDPVPREQMAAFFVRLHDGRDYTYGVDIGGPAGGPFLDVPAHNQFAGDIQRLLDFKVTRGCGDGKFCPERFVPREEMATFLMRYKHDGESPASGTRFSDVDGASEFVNAIGAAVDERIMEPCR